MSNNVVSQQFQLYDTQIVRKEHMSDVSDSLTSSHGFQNIPVSNGLTRPVEPNENIGGSRQTEARASGLGLPQSSSLPIKRKAEMELPARHSVPKQVAVPNKRVVPAGSSPRLTSSGQASSSHKKHVPVHSKVNSIASQNPPALKKKLVRNNDSTSGKSGSHQMQTPKGRNAESDDSVRSKMRDNVAAALSLVLQNKEEATEGENNNGGEAGNQQTSSGSQNLSVVVAEENKSQESGNLQFQEHSSAGESSNSQKSSGEVSTDESMCAPNQSSQELRSSIFPEEDGLFVKDDLLQGNGLSWAYDFDMGSTEMMEVHDNEKMENVESVGLKNNTKQSSPEELATEIEAELFKLFGGVNKKYKEKGRSLLFNLKDRNNPELRERVMSGEIPPDRLCSMTAEELASKELSEWRMAKAEELAQMKVLPDTDLTQRRLVKKTHKGEYQVDFEQDVGDATKGASADPSVLDQSNSASKEEEVTPSSKVDVTNGKTAAGTENNKLENQEISGSLVIPSDGTDLMQGIMVDELKDAEFLPPIISLDDFMECLNAEPPFEDLQVDAAVHSGVSPAKEEIQVSNTSPFPVSVADAPTTKSDEMVGMQPVHVAPKPSDRAGVQEAEVFAKSSEHAVVQDLDVAPKRSESPVVQRTLPTKAVSPKIEHIWAGILQLSISSSITTFGVFKSGDKTSTAEWSSSLEIKGRVRLDAFEKFIKELPNSRTRAVMVLHLVLKDKSSESERANLAEAVESYISDERLGFAEPATGVELYVCPPHEKMLTVLGNYVVNHRDDFLNSSENGLIGIVVWRKAPILSPNSSSHHKQQHSSSSKRQQLIKDANVNVKSIPKVASSHPPPSDDDDDSDIPPGFGPPTNRDDDDLPEFNFAGNMTTPMHHHHPSPKLQQPQRPADKLRQLIHMYGQDDPNPNVGNNSLLLDNKRSNSSSLGIAIEPWNDDDDDMPEWRPNVPLTPSSQPFARPLQPPPVAGYGINQQHLMHTGIQQQQQQQNLNVSGLPRGAAGGWQHVPSMQGRPQGNYGNPQPPVGAGLPPGPVLHAGQRQDGSRSRGF